MSKTLALALKDLRLLPRVRAGLFFTFVWPIVVTVLFGLTFSGQSGAAPTKVRIAVIDEDNTDASRAFLQKLSSSFELTPMPRADAETAVRRGQSTGFVVVKQGFSAASDRMFYGAPREMEIGVDPSRQAEAGMIEGLLMKHAATDLQRLMTGELKAFMTTPSSQAPPGAAQWQPLKVTAIDIVREWRGPRNAFDISFPQGVIWGLIGCVMTFGISLVTERTHGTLVRLRIAPLTRAQILGGKAIACFVSILIVELMLLGVALGFGVRPSSFALLGLAGLSAAVCFVGFMMLIASLGKTEQSASGAAWAILMPLSMIGGAMVPQFVMPAWMQSIGVVSPIRWALLAIEGAVWRQFSINEMVLPCAILIAVGVACFVVGTRGLKEA